MAPFFIELSLQERGHGPAPCPKRVQKKGPKRVKKVSKKHAFCSRRRKLRQFGTVPGRDRPVLGSTQNGPYLARARSRARQKCQKWHFWCHFWLLQFSSFSQPAGWLKERGNRKNCKNPNGIFTVFTGFCRNRPYLGRARPGPGPGFENTQNRVFGRNAAPGGISDFSQITFMVSKSQGAGKRARALARALLAF